MVKGIVLEHATEPELAAVKMGFGRVAFNAQNPADLRIFDGETPGGVRVGSDWWTNNMLRAWGGVTRSELEAFLAFNIGHFQEKDETALAQLDAQVGRLDGRIDDITPDAIGALSAEADPIFAASAALWNHAGQPRSVERRARLGRPRPSRLSHGGG